MKKLIVLAALLLSVVSAQATSYSIGFIWDVSNDPSVTGYNFYCSPTNVQPFTNVGSTNTNTFTISLDLTNSNQYCAVTAYNEYGLESVYSNIVTINKAVKPLPPTNYKRK